MKRAFTLVEVLTVVVIISILAALVTAAVAGAMRAGQRARIAVQMNHVAMALEHYKAEFGEYPPDMFDDDALVRHVRKRWPRYDAGNAQQIRTAIGNAYSDSPSGNINVNFSVNFLGANPETNSSLGALALWLGGFPNTEGKLSGFNADPENPFFVHPNTPDAAIPLNDRAYDGKAFLDWEVGEIGSNKNVRFVNYAAPRPASVETFVPVIGNEIRGAFVPIVYFRGRASGGNDAYRLLGRTTVPYPVKQFNFAQISDFSEIGWCVPYAEDGDETNVKWNNPTTYQLIHPGLDGKFGESLVRPNTGRIIKTGDGIGLQDLDNLTNFSDYKELKSILP